MGCSGQRHTAARGATVLKFPELLDTARKPNHHSATGQKSGIPPLAWGDQEALRSGPPVPREPMTPHRCGCPSLSLSPQGGRPRSELWTPPAKVNCRQGTEAAELGWTLAALLMAHFCTRVLQKALEGGTELVTLPVFHSCLLPSHMLVHLM